MSRMRVSASAIFLLLAAAVGAALSSERITQQDRLSEIVVHSPGVTDPRWIESTDRIIRARLGGWATVKKNTLAGWRVSPTNPDASAETIGWLASAVGELELAVACECPEDGRLFDLARRALPRSLLSAFDTSRHEAATEEGVRVYRASGRTESINGAHLTDASLGEVVDTRRVLALGFDDATEPRLANLTGVVANLRGADIDAGIALLVDGRLIAMADSINGPRRSVTFALPSTKAEAVHRLCMEGSLPVARPLEWRAAD